MNKTISFVKILLKGIGQIMLQENPITGFLFLIGIFYGSFTMGFAAILATICGTTTALLLKYDKTEINQGLYGFSAALVGVAATLFLKPIFMCWLIIIFGSLIATIIQHFFIQRKIPVFTLPFVLVTWAILYFSNNYAVNILAEPSTIIISSTEYFTFAFKGFGQVIFQNSLFAGILFFIAVGINSPISAMYGLAGAILSAAIAYLFSAPINDISMGLFSYNAVLCAIVFVGNKVKDSIWALVSVVLSLFISLFMLKFNIILLTFPFVLATCITLLIKIKTTSNNVVS